jgi:alkylation response protein AidB-like acyl-CoA dehydrogenase
MNQPGVEVRPIIQPDGTAEFNEVFFDGARAPVANVVGGVNNGWVVANTTLSHERGMSATTGYRRFHDEFGLLVAAARANGTITNALIRQRLARYRTQIEVLRINGLRSLSAALSGRKDPSVTALGATNKMFWSEMHRDAMELALDVHGADALLTDVGPPGGSWPGTQRAEGRPTYPVSTMVSAFFFSRSETIWGGTAEIQRNIVGERVLGLPREPRPAA